MDTDTRKITREEYANMDPKERERLKTKTVAMTKMVLMFQPESVDELIKTMTESLKEVNNDYDDFLRIIVTAYDTVVKGTSTEAEKKFLIFIKATVDKMLDQRRELAN